MRSNYIRLNEWYVVTHPYHNVNGSLFKNIGEVKAWMSNYVRQESMVKGTYPGINIS